MTSILKLAWKRLLVITSVIGDAQGRLIAMLFYFTVLVPFGVGTRLFSDPLKHAGKTEWLERHAVSPTLEDAKKQG